MVYADSAVVCCQATDGIRCVRVHQISNHITLIFWFCCRPNAELNIIRFWNDVRDSAVRCCQTTNKIWSMRVYAKLATIQHWISSRDAEPNPEPHMTRLRNGVRRFGCTFLLRTIRKRGFGVRAYTKLAMTQHWD